MALPKLVHERLTSSATAGTIVSTTAVPATRAFVGKVVFNWFSSAAGTLTLYAGSSATNATVLGSPISISQGEIFEQSVVLLAGEFVSVSVSVSNAGGVGILHLFGEEVDN